jgi:hypothetical protein
LEAIMGDQVTNLDLPAHDPHFPKPRGLLPVPPQVREFVAREQARLAPNYSDEYAKQAIDDLTLQWFFEGTDVACRETPDGIEVIAIGWDEIGELFRGRPLDWRQDFQIRQP